MLQPKPRTSGDRPCRTIADKFTTHCLIHKYFSAKHNGFRVINYDNTSNIVDDVRAGNYTGTMKLETAALVMDKMGNPTRLRIVRLLVRAGDEGLAVGAIQKKLKIPSSTLTHHIAQLKYAGLIRQERHQSTLYCKMEYERLSTVVDYLTKECCSDEASIESYKVT